MIDTCPNCQEPLNLTDSQRTKIQIALDKLTPGTLLKLGCPHCQKPFDLKPDGTALGMQTFDQHILELYENGLISEETAMVYASRKSAIGRGLDRIKAARGESTTGITGLAMKKKETH